MKLSDDKQIEEAAYDIKCKRCGAIIVMAEEGVDCKRCIDVSDDDLERLNFGIESDFNIVKKYGYILVIIFAISLFAVLRILEVV